MKNVFGLTIGKARFGPLAGKNLVEHENLLPNESKIADIIGTALEELRAGSMGQSMMNALQSGNATNAIANLDWGKFGQTLSTMRLPLEQQLAASGTGEAKALGDVIGHMAFNVTDPRAVEWAATRAGELVVTTSQAVRDDVRGVITQAFIEQTNPREIAGMIDRQVGLFPRWAQAVENRYQTSLSGFMGGGMSYGDAHDRAQNLADAYRERLIDKRCQMIARTEVIRAANEGRAQSWQQAADAGLIDPATTTKEWVAEADACDDCAGYDTEQVWLDDEFSSGDDMPPAHPNCRCSAVLVPDGEPTPKEEPVAPEIDTLPAMTSEDITPAPEEASGPIADIQNAIAEIPDWSRQKIDYYRESPQDSYVDLMEIADRREAEALRSAEEQVRSIGESVVTEMERRLDEQGIGAVIPAEQIETARVEMQEARDALSVALREATKPYAESLGMTGQQLFDSVGNDIHELNRVLREAIPELANMDSRARELSEGWNAMRDSNFAAEANRRDGFINTMREVLGEIRPMGAPEGGIQWADSFGPIGSAAEEQSLKALELYPTAWAEASNERSIWVGPLEGEGDRGFYRDSSSAIHIPESRANETTLYVHEWAHRFEYSNERIKNLEYAFIDARANGETARSLTSLTGGGYNASEVAIADSFASPYTGKVYDGGRGGSWEVLSTGMEGILNNTYGILTTDRDFLHFVLGTLAVA